MPAFLPPPLRALRAPRAPRPRRAPRCSLLAVAGATGGVGRLLIARLLSDAAATPAHPITAVRALVRSVPRAAAALPPSPRLTLRRVPSLPAASPDDLRPALAGVAVLVICLGTTAFPTRAWAGGNTPNAIDDVAVRSLVAALDPAAIRRVVLMSSIGTARARSFPFFILNAFGVLDAKRRGEMHVVDAASRLQCAYAILRPGRLIGAPHSNIGAAKEEPDDNCLDVAVEKGDTMSGTLSREAAAMALAVAAGWDTSNNLDLCIVHKEGGKPTPERWRTVFEAIQVDAPNSRTEPP